MTGHEPRDGLLMQQVLESISDCNAALDVLPSTSALLRRAACHMENEAFKEAVSDYEQAHD